MAAAVQAGLLAADDAAALMAAWQLAARIRNAVVLVRGRPGDMLPAKHGELTAVARLLGYPPATRPRPWSRTTAAPPAGPARSWSPCSTAES